MSTPDDSHFDPDDPRLTAYALGELPDPADRAHVEALLAASPEARAELADLRALTAALTAEYEQERLAVVDAPAAPTPANVIRLPDRRRAWTRPLLAAAAVLLVAGLLASRLLPVTSRVLVPGSRPATESAAVASTARKAAKDEAVSTPASPLFAATTPAAAPPTLLSKARPLTLDAPTSAPGSAGAYTGAISVNGGALLADSSKSSAAPPEVAMADRVTVTGSNLPTREEVGTARDVSLPAESQAMAPRKVLRASSVPTRGTLAATPFPANSKRGPTGSLASRSEVADQAPPAGAVGGVAVTAEPLGIADGRDLFQTKAKRPDTPTLALGAPEPASRREYAFNTAAYDHVAETPFLAAKDNPLSTFSVDVDTASYSIVRRFIEQGSLPPPDAVRIEEMLNYFPYNYAPPAPGDECPFAIHLEGAACPWNPDHRLVRVALKGREMARDKRPPSNLVFLIDVSGSMEPPERLPLIKESLRLLVERLTDNDRVAIVTYAGNSGLALPSTDGAHKDTILQALDHLEAGGSTNGASGIKLAYQVAQANFLKGGTNRVILATDGDFNVGTTSQGELVRLIEKEARGGVFLTALGVGTDNLKDATMQKLADHGNGNYAYLDRIEEGRKVLVEQMSGTLVTIAKDVKIQVEFNPATVGSYRLIGYEKRLLRKEDFNDDRVDAGEIGAGHSVTALYEVVPAGQPEAGSAPGVDALKYQNPPASAVDDSQHRADASAHELFTVKIRHKAPDGNASERSYEAAFVDHGNAADYANASPDFKFAAAVASFGLVLRDSPYKGNATLDAAVELAQEGKGSDATGYRAGFVELARRAQALRHEAASGSR